MSTQRTRPRWYVSDRAIDNWREVLTPDGDRGGDLKMLKGLKILRSIIVNIGMIAIGLYALRIGGDATIIGTAALAVLGGYNGLEFSDYLALVQAYKELEAENDE